jgi:cytidylate kinase
MIISISGVQGSGKSTIAKQLAEALGWPRYYMGGLRREAAKKRGLTLAEYNKLGETDPNTDLEVDRYQEELGKTQDNFIIEGRTSFHFIPQSLKIYLDVDPHAGAERIYRDLQQKNDRNEDNNLNSVEDVYESVMKRFKSDQLRYRQYFNIDVYDHANYDFCLDTTNLGVVAVYDKVYGFIKSRLDKA